MPRPPQDSSILDRIAAEPALVQLIAVLFAGGLLAFVLLRAARRVREARERSGTRDFLLGIEESLCGDLTSARRRLQRVVRDDPENRAARLLLAELTTALGSPAEAHREHVALQRAFGSNAPRNAIGLVRALLAAGCSRQALDAAESAAAAGLDDVDLLRARFLAEVACERDAAAAEVGVRLAARLGSGQECDEIREESARHAERAALASLRTGSADDPVRLLGVVRRAVGDTHPVARRLGERVRLAEAVRLALPADVQTALPVPVDELDLAGLVPVGPDLRLTPLGSIGRALDAIEANREHVQRLCEACAAGDEDAAAELVELGPDAVDTLLDAAIARGPDDVALGRVFAGIGVEIVPGLLAAWETRRVSRIGSRETREAAVRTMATILRALGPGARSSLEPLLSSEDRELRKVLIDYHLSLADPAAFRGVLEAMPPVEVLQRLNDAPDELLVPFLRAVPAGHELIEVLLPDPGFVRDVAVLDAIPGAVAPTELEGLLVTRGYARSLVAALVERLAWPGLAEVANRVLDPFGPQVLPALVMAFADLDRPDDVRQAVGRRLVATGSDAVLPLCRCFGASATPLDADAMAVLVEIGDVGVPALREAYRGGGLLERIAGPFARRRTHRREMLVWTLCGIGSLAARTALASLRERETDTDMSLRLSQALHRIDEVMPRPGTQSSEGPEGRLGFSG